MMNRITRSKVAALAVGMVGLAAAMPAAASDSVSVGVTATVVGVCKFFGSDYTMNIANSGDDIDPSSSTTATGSVTIEYRCSNGTTPIFTIPETVTLGGAGSMDVAITSSNEGAGSGMGSGQAKDLTITGNILQGEFQDKPVGSYTGTLNVSVNP